MTSNGNHWQRDRRPLRRWRQITWGFVLVINLWGGQALAVEHSYQTWVSGVLNASLEPLQTRLRGWFDFQVRRDNPGTQVLVRPALGVELGYGLSWFLGYTLLSSFAESGTDRHEHRLITVLWWQRSFGEQLDLILRTMIEMRAFQGESGLSARIRQLFRLNWNLCAPFFLFVFDEPFFHTNDADWGARAGFDQNRAGLGFGFPTVAHSRLEIAYMNMWVNPATGVDQSRHSLFITHLTVF